MKTPTASRGKKPKHNKPSESGAVQTGKRVLQHRGQRVWSTTVPSEMPLICEEQPGGEVGQRTVYGVDKNMVMQVGKLLRMAMGDNQRNRITKLAPGGKKRG